jgi:hypothetical protein
MTDLLTYEPELVLAISAIGTRVLAGVCVAIVIDNWFRHAKALPV